ncbi:MAG TPA: outer membrane protein transport protein [Rhodanobacteraceae bacterium]|nr:outer membrane protein transport protein [Rhodanobacteraceae bacterium]
MSRFVRQRPSAPMLAAVPLALAAALAGQDAQGSAFQLKENSAEGVGRSFAGSAAAPGDCSVVVNNPAAMSELKGGCFQTDVTAINFATKFHGSGEDFLGRPLTGGNGGDGGTTQPVPAIYFVHSVNDMFSLGAALTVPFGFQTEYNDEWVGRYEALKSKLQSPALTFAASWKLTDDFSLGASLIAQRTSAELTQAIDFGTILAGPTNGALLPQEADGFGSLKGDDWGYGFGLGALWKATPNDSIGVNFHSQIDHTIEGDGKFLVPSNIAPLLGGAFTNSDGQADFDTPAFATVSWWHTMDDQLSFGADLGYTHWSSFDKLVVHYANPAQPDSVSIFDWKDSWFFSLGGDYRLNNNWTLRAGVAYDETPTKDSTRTPRIPDGNRTWLSFGLGYNVDENLKFEAGYVHLWVDDGEVDHQSATFSTLTGHFQSSGNLLAVSGQYRF